MFTTETIIDYREQNFLFGKSLLNQTINPLTYRQYFRELSDAYCDDEKMIKKGRKPKKYIQTLNKFMLLGILKDYYNKPDVTEVTPFFILQIPENIPTIFSPTAVNAMILEYVTTSVTNALRPLIYQQIQKLNHRCSEFGTFIISGGDALLYSSLPENRKITSDIDTKFVPFFLSNIADLDEKVIYAFILQFQEFLWYDVLDTIIRELNEKYKDIYEKILRFLETTTEFRILNFKFIPPSDTTIRQTEEKSEEEVPTNSPFTKRFTLLKKNNLENTDILPSSTKQTFIDVKLFAIDLNIYHVMNNNNGYSYIDMCVVNDDTPANTGLLTITKNLKISGVLDLAIMKAPDSFGYEIGQLPLNNLQIRTRTDTVRYEGKQCVVLQHKTNDSDSELISIALCDILQEPFYDESEGIYKLHVRATDVNIEEGQRRTAKTHKIGANFNVNLFGTHILASNPDGTPYKLPLREDMIATKFELNSSLDIYPGYNAYFGTDHMNYQGTIRIGSLKFIQHDIQIMLNSNCRPEKRLKDLQRIQMLEQAIIDAENYLPPYIQPFVFPPILPPPRLKSKYISNEKIEKSIYVDDKSEPTSLAKIISNICPPTLPDQGQRGIIDLSDLGITRPQDYISQYTTAMKFNMQLKRWEGTETISNQYRWRIDPVKLRNSTKVQTDETKNEQILSDETEIITSLSQEDEPEVILRAFQSAINMNKKSKQNYKISIQGLKRQKEIGIKILNGLVQALYDHTREAYDRFRSIPQESYLVPTPQIFDQTNGISTIVNITTDFIHPQALAAFRNTFNINTFPYFFWKTIGVPAGPGLCCVSWVEKWVGFPVIFIEDGKDDIEYGHIANTYEHITVLGKLYIVGIKPYRGIELTYYCAVYPENVNIEQYEIITQIVREWVSAKEGPQNKVLQAFYMIIDAGTLELKASLAPMLWDDNHEAYNDACVSIPTIIANILIVAGHLVNFRGRPLDTTIVDNFVKLLINIRSDIITDSKIRTGIDFTMPLCRQIFENYVIQEYEPKQAGVSLLTLETEIAPGMPYLLYKGMPFTSLEIDQKNAIDSRNIGIIPESDWPNVRYISGDSKIGIRDAIITKIHPRPRTEESVYDLFYLDKEGWRRELKLVKRSKIEVKGSDISYFTEETIAAAEYAIRGKHFAIYQCHLLTPIEVIELYAYDFDAMIDNLLPTNPVNSIQDKIRFALGIDISAEQQRIMSDEFKAQGEAFDARIPTNDIKTLRIRPQNITARPGDDIEPDRGTESVGRASLETIDNDVFSILCDKAQTLQQNTKITVKLPPDFPITADKIIEHFLFIKDFLPHDEEKITPAILIRAKNNRKIGRRKGGVSESKHEDENDLLEKEEENERELWDYEGEGPKLTILGISKNSVNHKYLDLRIRDESDPLEKNLLKKYAYLKGWNKGLSCKIVFDQYFQEPPRVQGINVTVDSNPKGSQLEIDGLFIPRMETQFNLGGPGYSQYGKWHNEIIMCMKSEKTVKKLSTLRCWLKMNLPLNNDSSKTVLDYIQYIFTLQPDHRINPEDHQQWIGEFNRWLFRQHEFQKSVDFHFPKEAPVQVTLPDGSTFQGRIHGNRPGYNYYVNHLLPNFRWGTGDVLYPEKMIDVIRPVVTPS